MKFILSISLNILLLFVFTTMTTNSAWACSGKGKCQKETIEHKAKAKCQKDCCKKTSSDSKKSKKSCCGDDCSCSPATTIMADLPRALFIDNARFYPVFSIKNAFFYKQASSKSSIQDILQPPISALA